MNKQNFLTRMLLLFALIVESVNGAWGIDETITTMATSGSGTNFSWSTAQNGGASAPALNSGNIRLYANNTITFTATNGKKFQTIKLTTGRNTHQWSNASSDPAGFVTDTWTASDETTTTVTITNNNSGKGNLQISQFDITYVEETIGGVSKPTFSATGLVAAGTKITLTQNDADEIRYTTDGSEPTKTTGKVYSDPITITSEITIKAIAIQGEDVSSVATVNYTISVAAPVFTPGTGSYLKGCPISIASAGNTIYYTTDGTTPNNTKTEYSAPIVAPTGKTTFKAIAYDSYGNSSTVSSCTITGIEPVELPFGWDGGTTRTQVNDMEGVLQTGLDSDYAEDTYKLKFNTTNDNIIIFTDEKPEKVAIGVKMIGGSKTSTFVIQESDSGAEFSDLEELTISGSQNDVVNLKTTKAFAATTRVIKINFVKGDNVGVGPFKITKTEPIEVTSAGYATYVSNYDLDYSGLDVKAYKASVSGTAITFTKVTTVPAGEGVLLQGAPDTYNVPVAAYAVAAWADSENAFIRGTGAAVDSGSGPYNYILNDGANGIGFYKANGKTVAKNRAYLQSTVPGARLSFSFDDEAGEATGINEVKNVKADAAIYNLNGVRVKNMTKGLYIMNGKKVIVK